MKARASSRAGAKDENEDNTDEEEDAMTTEERLTDGLLYMQSLPFIEIEVSRPCSVWCIVYGVW
jgi:hypothetical protein